jgi:hypothetical protein
MAILEGAATIPHAAEATGYYHFEGQIADVVMSVTLILVFSFAVRVALPLMFSIMRETGQLGLSAHAWAAMILKMAFTRVCNATGRLLAAIAKSLMKS